jgi:hypothetical protein
VIQKSDKNTKDLPCLGCVSLSSLWGMDFCLKHVWAGIQNAKLCSEFKLKQEHVKK